MSANLGNALIDLVKALFELYMGVLVLRILLQQVRADFYNPISQLIWKFTRPLVDPVGRIIPKFRRVDTATLVVLFVFALIEVHVLFGMYGFPIPILSALFQALVKLLALTLNIYTLSMIVQAMLSWLGPGVNNPAGSILWSINEPLLRPVRRILPPVSGFDLSMIPVILLLHFFMRLLPLHPYLQ